MSKEYIDKFHLSAELWQGKLDHLADIFAEDLIYHVSPFPDIIGLEAFRQFLMGFHLAFPDFQVDIQEDLVQGEASCHRWVCWATFSGQSPIMPVPPTGKFGKGPGCHIIHWKDGKAVEAWHFGDWLGWFQQFGIIPSFAAAAT